MEPLNFHFVAFQCLIIILVFCCNFSLISTLSEEDETRFEDVTASHSPSRCYPETTYGNHTFVKLKKQGITLHYVESGDRTKPLLLFLHGLPEFWLTFRYQIPYFAKSYWVVAADLRGYGDSDKPKSVSEYKLDILQTDIAELIHSLGREECYIVAHDWGGTVAVDLAAKNPQLVTKLVFTNATPLQMWHNLRRTRLEQSVRSLYVPFFRVPPYLPEIGWLTIARHIWFFYQSIVTKISKRDRQAFLCNLNTLDDINGPLNYYRAFGKVPAIPEEQPKVEVPTLVIWGGADPLVSIKLPQMFPKYFKNLQMVYFPSTSRIVHAEEPEKVNKLIEQFLSS